jgi:uracil phosphoribosyltransferase
VRVVSLLVTAQAANRLRAHHPDVHIWTAGIDEEIDEQGYILPGLGDVGDRMYGTR